MYSQESVGESRVSQLTGSPRAYDEVDPYGWSTEEEIEAALKRMYSMEEDQEVTSLPQPGDMHVKIKKVKPIGFGQPSQYQIYLLQPGCTRGWMVL